MQNLGFAPHAIPPDTQSVYQQLNPVWANGSSHILEHTDWQQASIQQAENVSNGGPPGFSFPGGNGKLPEFHYP